MQPQMTQEQATVQIEARMGHLKEVREFKLAEIHAYETMDGSIVSHVGDLAQVFPESVIAAHRLLNNCKLTGLHYELRTIDAEIAQGEKVLQQFRSPILVPSVGRALGGGGIHKI